MRGVEGGCERVIRVVEAPPTERRHDERDADEYEDEPARAPGPDEREIGEIEGVSPNEESIHDESYLVLPNDFEFTGRRRRSGAMRG